MDKNKSKFNKMRIITYVIISYAISWMIWIPSLLNYNFNFGLPYSRWLHFFGGLGPILGALITILIFDKNKGINKYFKEKFLTFPNIKWLLVGIMMPTIFFFIIYISLGLLLGDWTNLYLIGLNSKVPFTNIIVIWILWCFFYGIGEEGGWRGFLLPEFNKKYKTNISTFYTALIWAFWHLPLFFYDKDFTTMGIGGIFGWFIGLVFGSLLLGWLTIQSKWSLWPAILWHGTFNLFTTSDQINPLFPAVISMQVILISLWIARKYGDDLEHYISNKS